MAYLPDDLFEELHSTLSVIMMEVRQNQTFRWYECCFCLRKGDTLDDLEHTEGCLGMRLVRAMDAEKRSQLGSG